MFSVAETALNHVLGASVVRVAMMIKTFGCRHR